MESGASAAEKAIHLWEMLPFYTSAGRGEHNIAMLFLLCL